jgi:hypothetical protein
VTRAELRRDLAEVLLERRLALVHGETDAAEERTMAARASRMSARSATEASG